MKKVVYMIFITLALSVNVNASEYNIFIGGEAGATWADFDGPNGEYQNKEIKTYGAKIGIDNVDTRVYLAYKYIDAFEDSTTRDGEYQTLTANAEAFTDSLDIFGITDLSFFVGGHAGAVNINVDASFGQLDKYAFLYGAQVGLMARFGSIVSFEAGYRYSLSNFSEEGTTLDRLQVAYGGINIKF